MGLLDVAERIAVDMLDRNVPVTVYYGPEFKAQDDAAFRVVFVPNQDSFDLKHSMNGSNPRPIRTRHAGALVQLWAADPTVPDGPLKAAADWRALDALINAFLLSLHMVSGPNNYELGAGNVNTRNPHVHYGFQYDVQIWVMHPIVDTEWELVSPVEADITYHLIFGTGGTVSSTIPAPQSDISIGDA